MFSPVIQDGAECGKSVVDGSSLGVLAGGTISLQQCFLRHKSRAMVLRPMKGEMNACPLFHSMYPSVQWREYESMQWRGSGCRVGLEARYSYGGREVG